MLIKKEIKLISKKKEVVLNENIKASKVRLIDYDGKQHGIVSIDEALERASSLGFDLIELNPDSNPPVCKIIDYGKYKYEQQRQKKLNKKKQHIIHVKEIRVRPNIGQHDLVTKLKKGQKFLLNGDILIYFEIKTSCVAFKNNINTTYNATTLNKPVIGISHKDKIISPIALTI